MLRFVQVHGNLVSKDYRLIKDELIIGTQNLILRGTPIVIQRSLQQRSVNIVHESHQGLSKKISSLLREKIWFPRIDELVKNTIQSCLACQATRRQNPPEPVQLYKYQNYHGVH